MKDGHRLFTGERHVRTWEVSSVSTVPSWSSSSRACRASKASPLSSSSSHDTLNSVPPPWHAGPPEKHQPTRELYHSKHVPSKAVVGWADTPVELCLPVYKATCSNTPSHIQVQIFRRPATILHEPDRLWQKYTHQQMTIDLLTDKNTTSLLLLDRKLPFGSR